MKGGAGHARVLWQFNTYGAAGYARSPPTLANLSGSRYRVLNCCPRQSLRVRQPSALMKRGPIEAVGRPKSHDGRGCHQIKDRYLLRSVNSSFNA